MSNNPILSVIIPCYNNGRYLIQMLDCCKKQTLQDWEVIVVDDGSTDETLSIVKEYASKEPRISFFCRERHPKGSVTCRNIGFEKSKGKYVIHFDADDLISETCFENRVNFMENHPECDYASFPAKSFHDIKELPFASNTIADYGADRGDDILSAFLSCSYYPFSVWCNIYRRKSIENYQWDENVVIYTDFSFIIPVILGGLKHLFSDAKEIDYYYRASYTTTNMCANFVSEAKAKSTCYLFNKTLNALHHRSDYELRRLEYRGFVLVQLERLVLNNNSDFTSNFLNVIKPFYPDEIQSFLSIVRKCERINNDMLRHARFAKWIYAKYGINKYKKVMIHSFGKFLLRRNK